MHQRVCPEFPEEREGRCPAIGGAQVRPDIVTVLDPTGRERERSTSVSEANFKARKPLKNAPHQERDDGRGGLGRHSCRTRGGMRIDNELLNSSGHQDHLLLTHQPRQPELGLPPVCWHPPWVDEEPHSQVLGGLERRRGKGRPSTGVSTGTGSN